MSAMHIVEIDEQMTRRDQREATSYEIRVAWQADVDRQDVLRAFDFYVAEVRAQIGVDPWKHFVPLDRLVIQEKP